MKKSVFLICFLLINVATFGQLSNENSMTVMIDGKEFKTQPRQIKIGSYAYLTGNGSKPDRMNISWRFLRQSSNGNWNIFDCECG
jgi:hypothetical protein